MAQSAPRSKHPVTWGAVTVLLAATVAAALWVPFYSRTRPKLGAFPFFYWYQLVLVPVVAAVCWICYLMLRARPSRDAGNGGGGRR
jgi:Protein of unknown function (DUF3311)